ncbi:unnamed protein product [Aphis gossypii]|uniref:Uncharacterized protein n=1 Tax=Aphis gossypii TaxID=80765 RepID=A0A9P0IPD2_APHGO|nr:unnamed protein product [Aphis gossypii]
MILLYFSARPKRIRGICRTRGGGGKYYIHGSNTVRDWSACANAHIITRTRTQQCDSIKILKKIKYIRKTTNEPPRPAPNTLHRAHVHTAPLEVGSWDARLTCAGSTIYIIIIFFFLHLYLDPPPSPTITTLGLTISLSVSPRKGTVFPEDDHQTLYCSTYSRPGAIVFF